MIICTLVKEDAATGLVLIQKLMKSCSMANVSVHLKKAVRGEILRCTIGGDIAASRGPDGHAYISRNRNQ